MLKARRLWTVAFVSLLSVTNGGTSAQAPTAPAFDVASIKLNRSGTNQRQFEMAPNGRFTAINVPLADVIRIAYSEAGPGGFFGPLLPDRLVPAKTWAGGARALQYDKYDIVATTQAGVPQPQMALMLRALLAERFKLVVHREAQELSAYALVMARRDGRLGPRLRPSNVDCAAVASAEPAKAPTTADFVAEPCKGLRNVPGKATGRAVEIPTLAHLITGWVEDHRPIEDRTGLTGAFDIDLDWTPDRPQPVGAPVLPPVDPNGPGLFTALQEQLGLKLEPAKRSIDLVVVDSAEPPTAN